MCLPLNRPRVLPKLRCLHLLPLRAHQNFLQIKFLAAHVHLVNLHRQELQRKLCNRLPLIRADKMVVETPPVPLRGYPSLLLGRRQQQLRPLKLRR